jgi:hypothetical protein
MNTILYPVFNANARRVGVAASATQAGELLGLDAMLWDVSNRPINVTLSNVQQAFAFTDTRLATDSLVGLLKVVEK